MKPWREHWAYGSVLLESHIAPELPESRVLEAYPPLLCEFSDVLDISSRNNHSTEFCEGKELLWKDLWILILAADCSEVVLSSEDGWAQLRVLHIQDHLCMPSLKRPRAYVRLENFYLPYSAEWTCELAFAINTTSVVDMTKPVGYLRFVYSAQT